MEQEIIRELVTGNKEALAKLYELYSAYALRMATAVTKNHETAADAVQETFIRLFHHIGSYDPTKEFKPWFYRILLNECKRLMKNRNKIISLQDCLERDLPSGHDTHRIEEYEDLYQVIQQLDELNRIPIILKYINDLSDKEIAEVLGENLNTVKSRLFKGRQKIKSALELAQERGATHGR